MGTGTITVIFFLFLLYVTLVTLLCVKAAENTSWKMATLIASGGIFLPFAAFSILAPGMLLLLAYLVPVMMVSFRAADQKSLKAGMLTAAGTVILPVGIVMAFGVASIAGW
ncbi:hypothetical protein ABT167_39455 [Streptomyces sp. NPDC001792]|uniref:hypothetical protein n=1 Tax=Streptomyces sp. NPDC001792 TaxID=3154524 RepID=UPI00332E0019